MINAYLNSNSGEQWDIVIEDSNGNPIIWKGNLPTHPSNPELNWVYYATEVGAKYRWDGNAWVIYEGVGQIKTISDKDYIPQKLKQLLLTGFGEVKTNTQYGVPWVQEILGLKNPDLNSVATTILDVIDEDEVLKELGVSSTEITNMELDKTTRNLSMNIVCKLSDETSVTVEGISI